MKFNWGKAIILAFVLFISFIVYIVYGSMTTKVDLVAKDYYSKELKYQDDINKQNNTKGLSISFSTANKMFRVQLPKSFKDSKTTGSLVFYRPSDAKLDKSFVVDTMLDYIEVPSSFLIPGKWVIILEVKHKELDYQFKEELFL